MYKHMNVFTNNDTYKQMNDMYQLMKYRVPRPATSKQDAKRRTNTIGLPCHTPHGKPTFDPMQNSLMHDQHIKIILLLICTLPFLHKNSVCIRAGTHQLFTLADGRGAVQAQHCVHA
jgi:hypothetical protein